jgi:hypothetical protein
MEVAPLPDSREYGSDIPICRAVWRIVGLDGDERVAGRIVGRRLHRGLDRGEPLDVQARRVGPRREERQLSDLHERPGAADAALGVAGQAGDARTTGSDEPPFGADVIPLRAAKATTSLSTEVSWQKPLGGETSMRSPGAR